MKTLKHTEENVVIQWPTISHHPDLTVLRIMLSSMQSLFCCCCNFNYRHHYSNDTMLPCLSISISKTRNVFTHSRHCACFLDWQPALPLLPTHRPLPFLRASHSIAIPDFLVHPSPPPDEHSRGKGKTFFLPNLSCLALSCGLVGAEEMSSKCST